MLEKSCSIISIFKETKKRVVQYVHFLFVKTDIIKLAQNGKYMYNSSSIERMSVDTV